MHHDMRLTASIVTYRTDLLELEKVLELVARSCVEKVFVIDNARQKGVEDLCARFPGCVYIPSANRGYGAGHNRAIEKAMQEGARLHLVMNSDISFSPDSLALLAGYMEDNPDVGCLQPRIVNPLGELQYTVRRLPAPIDLIWRRFFPRSLMRGRLDDYELRNVDHSVEFNVPCHQGSFMFLRTDALRKVGLFDERFFLYGEDIDLTRRIHESYRTMYVPFVTVVHRHRQESYHSLRMLGIHCVNMVRYFNKWGWFRQK